MKSGLWRYLGKDEWLNWFLIFVPATFVVEWMHAPAPVIFLCACAAIVPLAGWMGRATEHLSASMGPGIGGLLNATFGNAAEFIIAAFALQKGLIGVVKASITGSIIGNILLVLGFSQLFGGMRYSRQTFNRTSVGLGATLLALSVFALMIPAVFHSIGESALKQGGITFVQEHSRELNLSLEIAGVLFFVYLLHLFFSLKTHKDLFAGDKSEEEGKTHWSTRRSGTVLLAATTGVALVSEVLVGAVEQTAKAWGMTDVFVGVIVVAIVGNAAEHSTAVLMSMKNKMDLAMHIAIGSSIQIALFVAPLLLFLSYAFGKPMDLLFTPFEILSVGMAVWAVNLVAQDGESHWMEGVLLLAVYAIIGFAFYALPPEAHL